MWLPWQYAVWLSVVLAVIAVVLRIRTPPRRWQWLGDLAREGAIFAILYAVWQRVGGLTAHDTSYALSRGLWIAHFERAVYLPSEVSVQHLVLHSVLLIKAANWYYVLGHAPVMGIFLVWLYVRHRGEFGRWRTTLAVASILGELIQIMAVAPPRLTLPGIVDTAHVYGPQVYSDGGAGFAPQLAAMPSLHCAWAITTGAAIFVVAKSRWRWIGPVHAVVTVLVVVVTGNHYWLDAIVGGALVLVGLGVHDGSAYLWRRWRRASAALATAADADVLGAAAASVGDHGVDAVNSRG
ncbi:MAG TPA: phosphatase PAP2 family protein [Micromonosporaceae bacterium]|jgi:hypothetical protein